MLYDYSHYTYDYTVNYKTLQVAIMFSSGRKLLLVLKIIIKMYVRKLLIIPFVGEIIPPQEYVRGLNTSTNMHR